MIISMVDISWIKSPTLYKIYVADSFRIILKSLLLRKLLSTIDCVAIVLNICMVYRKSLITGDKRDSKKEINQCSSMSPVIRSLSPF